MSVPFDPKELEIVRRQPSFNPAVPGTALFNFPMTEREAYKSTVLNKELVWQPYGVETGFLAPSVIPDNIARGFVFEARRWPEPYTTHDDMFGVNWTYVPTVGGSMETPGIPHPMEDVNDWKTALKWPDPYSWDWDESARINNDNLKNNGKANILWFLNGMGFERLISFMGFENAAMALLDEDQEDALHELLHALTDLHLTLVKLCCDTYGEGLTGFCLHDDWGSQKSPFFSVAAGRDFFVDEWKRFTSYVHSLGRIADLHSCGHIDAHIENIVAGGWDSWTPMAMNDTHKLYEDYGDKLVIGIVADKWDPTASEEEQYEAGKKFAEKFCKPGKVGAYSMYTGIPMTDAYARGVYETSRKMA